MELLFSGAPKYRQYIPIIDLNMYVSWSVGEEAVMTSSSGMSELGIMEKGMEKIVGCRCVLDPLRRCGPNNTPVPPRIESNSKVYLWL